MCVLFCLVTPQHIAKQWVPGLSSDFLKKGKHFLLIRNPLDILVGSHVFNLLSVTQIQASNAVWGLISSLCFADCYINVFCQPSFDKVVPTSFLELGFAELIAIHGELSALGKPPPVIDATELRKNPEVSLSSLKFVIFVEEFNIVSWIYGA